MSDPFTMLGLPRRPWLDEAAVRAAFQQRAREWHPDAAGGDAEKFRALNAAHAAVTDSASRLRLLAGDAAVPAMPSGAEMGFRIADLSRKTGVLAGKAEAAVNPLAKALAAHEAEAVGEELREAGASLEELDGRLQRRLLEADDRWPGVEAAELAALAGEFVFLARWQAQLREARLVFEIAFGK